MTTTFNTYKTTLCQLDRASGFYPQTTKFMVPTWGPPGSCRSQMGPMLAPWTLLSGSFSIESEWYIYASVNLTIIGSDDGVSPFRHQAIIWRMLVHYQLGPWGPTFIKISVKMQQFAYKKISLKTSLENDHFVGVAICQSVEVRVTSFAIIITWWGYH